MSRQLWLTLVFSFALHAAVLAYLWQRPTTGPQILDVQVSYARPAPRVSSPAKPQKKSDLVVPPKSSNPPAPNTSDSTTAVTQAAETAAADAAPGQPESSTQSLEGSALGISVVYPRLSRVMRESGIVLIHYNPSTRDLRVEKSSGFPRLDESARSAAQDAFANNRVAPPKEDSTIRFVFVLKP